MRAFATAAASESSSPSAAAASVTWKWGATQDTPDAAAAANPANGNRVRKGGDNGVANNRTVSMLF